MKFLFFIDRIYSKIMKLSILLAIPCIVLSLYLYIQLPKWIPVQFGWGLEPTRWGHRATIFIFPTVLLILPTFMSKKAIKSQEKSVGGRLTAELISVFVFIIMLIIMVGVYSLYFKMI